MKKLLVLLILLAVFTTGCSGLFNLNGWVVPDDAEFLALIERLDTPEKICLYMQDNFEYEAHIFYILTPYKLYLIKKGDCDDFANFAVFIANYHGYETFLMKIHYKNYALNHYLAIYEENNLYNVSDNQYYFSLNYDNFSDIIRLNTRWKYNFCGYTWAKYIVYDFWNNEIEIEYNN